MSVNQQEEMQQGQRCERRRQGFCASRLALLLLGSSIVLYAYPGLALDAKECAVSYEQAQTLRRANKLRAARDRLLVCAQPTCPKFMVADCSQWLGEVERGLSSVVLSARDASGHDVTNVRVLFDGVALSDHLDGREVQVDPGVHTFRFELEHAPPIEQEYVVRQGERNRLINVQFAPDPAPATTAESSPALVSMGGGSAADAQAPQIRRLLGYGLEGLGAVGIGGFVYFALSGRADLDRLRKECAPNCAQSDVDAARGKLVIGDISLAVGLASAGIGTWLLLSSSSPSAPAAQIGLRPTPGGGTAELSGKF
jgi:hypothetical protein